MIHPMAFEPVGPATRFGVVGPDILVASSFKTVRSDPAFLGWTFATIGVDDDVLVTRRRATPEPRAGKA